MKKWNYYNEFDPKAAAWIRELIRSGLVPDGEVDSRSITEVRPSDLEGFIQCHFFAGICGWSLALRLAGWPADRPVWTGSCPCQPFSSAGKQLGDADERHLWPAFFNLIRECRPQPVFGEQVANAIGKGWLDGISADLESEGYACGAVVLGAHSAGAPHIRQRLYWVADSAEQRCDRGKNSEAGWRETLERSGTINGLGNSDGAGLQKRPQFEGRKTMGHKGATAEPASALDGAWGNHDIIPCTDRKLRRTQSGIFPLAHGIPGRVGLLRGYGNAIVPQIAAEFIIAAMSP